jgi:CTP-dependent riboflavin kinase
MTKGLDMEDQIIHNRTDTSIAAGTRIAKSKGKIVRRIEALIGDHPHEGVTCEEIANALNMRIQTVSARLVELHTDKLIAPMSDAAGREMRRSTTSGRTAVVWKRGWQTGDREAKRRKKRKDRPSESQSVGPIALRILRYAVDSHDRGITCQDVEDALQIRHQTASSTLTHLRKLKLIVDRQARRDGGTVWRITEAGRDRLFQIGGQNNNASGDDDSGG